MKVQYIYFELAWLDGVGLPKPIIQHENILLLKPNTNSMGVWSFLNQTKRINCKGDVYSTVHQYWIDLEKFNKNGSDPYDSLREHVKAVLITLNL